ncbi:heat-inducible transcriptional repressor HrcA [Desulfohalobium retbaense]|uniref:Heat-inducible transcription repressor HrcA n=1 Tax=Desulfohalobium retbaense (strain ATCC 49708 / DSM 5692 / JCM 16813 / HR100) TaxID=485915 RepID=C8WZY2_DESRD|nr:heat-inducible transcriptional repressor HrcA [Desulfohalobium retbaense]ACV67607.1 heat-inducible transcription repressor HrcA [Desulfohalobium retbaense DSM 5692]
MDLFSREQTILRIIVEAYIETASPVGSRYVARHSGLDLSPASIRNSMADLTEACYLEQPHTSAGRVPTGRAFRFYLDTILQLRALSFDEESFIQHRLGAPGLEISQLLQRAAKLLASLSRQVSMVLAPQHDTIRWQQIDFVRVRADTVMAILVAQGGIIRQRLISVEEPLSQDDLIVLSNYLNTHFRDRPIHEVKTAILHELQQVHGALDALTARALQLAGATCLESDNDRNLFVNGTSRILDHPEFADLQNARELLSLLEERTRLYTLLDKISLDHPAVTLGNEFDDKQLQDCSVVSAPYRLHGHPLGLVSVIGPMRMNYAKVVPVVDFTAQILTQLLQSR